jgi:hypothetical protein
VLLGTERSLRRAITRPDESYRVSCVWVWSRSLHDD